MGRLSRILGSPLRYYRSRGFGIHSPFAYRLIREVVRCPYPRYGYYAYGKIHDLCRAGGVSGSSGFRLYRLLVFANPSKVHISSGLPPCLHEIVNLYHPFGGKGSLWVINTTSDFGDSLWNEVRGGSPCFVLATNLSDRQVKDCFNTLCDAIGYGMVFTNGDRALLCALRGLPRQKYKVWL